MTPGFVHVLILGPAIYTRLIPFLLRKLQLLSRSFLSASTSCFDNWNSQQRKNKFLEIRFHSPRVLFRLNGPMKPGYCIFLHALEKYMIFYQSIWNHDDLKGGSSRTERCPLATTRTTTSPVVYVLLADPFLGTSEILLYFLLNSLKILNNTSWLRLKTKSWMRSTSHCEGSFDENDSQYAVHLSSNYIWPI